MGPAYLDGPALSTAEGPVLSAIEGLSTNGGVASLNSVISTVESDCPMAVALLAKPIRGLVRPAS